MLVPPKGRTTVLQELHGGHPGIKCMKSLARGIVWWPKLDKEIETMGMFLFYFSDLPRQSPSGSTDSLETAKPTMV